jgi:hypothetical protein
MSQSASTAKDAALRMVGRTVVNFQRLEHNLKLAARLGPLQGTAQRIQKDIAKRHERAATLTLGQAIQAWLAYCYGSSAAHAQTPDLFDATFEMSFSVESDAESRAQHAKDLSDLLQVRNDLIHVRLATFEWDSPEACADLVVELEKVNDSISGQIAYTSLLLKDIAELFKEHAEFLAVEFVTGASGPSAAMPNTSLERTREG